MAKWEVPNDMERQLLEERRRNPDKYVVNRVGEDQLVFLEHRPRLDPIPREELYIRIEKKE